MRKALLVDSVYVNYGGALTLLQYLIESLQQRGVYFKLLADARSKDKFDGIIDVDYLDAKERRRIEYYSSNRDSFSSVFCFGNVPPPISLKVPVYTYFHNINMLTLNDCRNRKQKIKLWLKRLYIKIHRNYTNEWFVQTRNTALELIKNLNVSINCVRILPFYKIPKFELMKQPRRDYVFVGDYSGSKGHDELLTAWVKLHERGVDLTLHLTVSVGERFLRQLNIAISSGVHIINHGYILPEELASLYMQCKATVYPSYNESFGLGLVEAMEAGCDVIASDRPFVHSICEPSEVFNASKPETIVEAVLRYERGHSKKTRQLVSDMVGDLIERIV